MQGLSFEEFMDKVRAEIKNYLPEKYADSTVNLQEVLKNNDKRLHALTVSSPDGNVAPTIYLEQYFGDYMDGHSFEDVMEQIANVRMEHEVGADMDVSMISDFEKAKGKIIPRLINAESNQDMFSERPHTNIGEDLAVSYHIYLGEREGGTMTAPVTNALQESYGISTEELHDIAMSNMSELTPAKFQSLGEVIMGMMGEDTMEDMPTLDNGMFVLTNAQNMFGAVALLDEKMMDDITQKVGDFYILPSSVHETLIVPRMPGMDLQTLENMVVEVNTTQVRPEERLSDHVYAYDAQTHEIYRADKEQEYIAMKEKLSEKLALAQDIFGRKPSLMAKLSEKKIQAAEMAASVAMEKGAMTKGRDAMTLA